ncbi:unnamed protein product [Adineta steineri]|uniref:Peptidyl-prolyl cis-trans isomerase n=1 Tax=Adineta steineri TaxID=433720 RepID=A0A818Z8J3_9BILA|nr:unnamed protein product [Adineta steineri]
MESCFRNYRLGMIYSRDFIEGDGTGSKSIYGETFTDETFQIKRYRSYLLSLYNQGPNIDESQSSTTSEASHLDRKHVVFGHVITSHSIVDTIEIAPTDSNLRPLNSIVVVDCGVMNSGKI